MSNSASHQNDDQPESIANKMDRAPSSPNAAEPPAAGDSHPGTDETIRQPGVRDEAAGKDGQSVGEQADEQEGTAEDGRGPVEPLDRDWSSEELDESRSYGRKSLICDLVEMAVDVGYLLLATLFIAQPLDRWLMDVGWATPWLRLAAFFLFFTGVHYVVTFPLSYYAGFVLEHQFGLSKQRFGRWLARYFLRVGLMLVFGGLLMQGFYWTIWLTGPAWWIVATVATFVVSVLLGQLVPVVILPLFYKVEPLDDERIRGKLASLAEGTTLTIEGVYRIVLSTDTKKANAMLTGLGRTRRVILGDTLLDSFTDEEIEVVFAHEVGHHVHRHIFKLMAWGLVASGIGFLVCDQFLRLAFAADVPYSELPVWTLPMLMLVITGASMLVGPLQNALSRHFERQCDRYALERTDNPAAYRTAFRKLARLNKADPDPHPLEVFLFDDHPPINERLAMAGEFSSERSPTLDG